MKIYGKAPRRKTVHVMEPRGHHWVSKCGQVRDEGDYAGAHARGWERVDAPQTLCRRCLLSPRPDYFYWVAEEPWRADAR